jgi:ketosteroid isomerase-like protein
MIGRCVAVLAAVLAVGGFGAAVRAEDSARCPEQEGFCARYDLLGKAFKQKDVAAIMAQLAPDFSAKTAEGKVVDRAQFEIDLKQTLGAMKSVPELTLKLAELKIDGDRAATVVQLAGVVTMADAEGKESTVAVRATLRDTWVKAPEGWRLQRFESEPSAEAAAPQPVPAPPAGPSPETPRP